MYDIIVAHNDGQLRDLFYETFSNLGYKTQTMVNHEKIIEILNKERPYCIILDSAISDIPADILFAKIKTIDENIKVLIFPPDKEALTFIQEIIKIIVQKKTALAPKNESQDESPKKNILVVDDEKESAELVKNYLSKKGYTTDFACSGEEAIHMIKKTRPDVVLLDIRMTGMDGIIALKTIKDIDKSIIIIMTSATENREIIKEAIEYGANGYLIKPFNLKKLESMILSNIL